MAKNNVRLPSSTAGITSFSDADNSIFHLKPGQVIAFIIVVLLLVLVLNMFGAQWFGL